ncbi:MAG TPA: adenylate/guanylate cyclase domain-containing protein [Candidatus Limnocylindrales bacterium]|nr:adenylate/guanylate cyclase domain-containing protein [Candidatus Limnocylindrales bacterium]
MICGNCGAANDAGRKFCLECGTRLAAGCPSCGSQNPPAARFCGECGSGLGVAAGETAGAARPAEGPLASAGKAAAPVAERRHVSILFADLVGFTGLAEDRDPEAVRELLTRYFDLSREVIARYGGTVEKFIGDAVMAVWGAPTAREDDAERAVRAALDLVDVVRSLGTTERGEPVQARAAVLTGDAAVTIGATNQGLVAGDLVNTASRLQSVAPAGSVLVGEATFQATSQAIAYEPAGEQLLKGKTAPVAAWRALRIVAKIGGVGRSEGLEPPFVGRDEQLRLLKGFLHATSRERRLQLVSVVGQAGTGKSRLTWEFLKYIDGLVENVFWHQGRSPSYGEGITFWALGEMVRKRAGLAESDDHATTRTKIAAALAEYVPDEAERRWIEPKLLGLLGLEELGALEREELFAAWRTFFERVSEQGPTVLVFEDIHWADQGLLDFIDHMAEWSSGHPILLVTLARPEFLDRHRDWGAGRRDFVSLSLDPLPDGQMDDLLSGLVPGLPESARQAILARAEGIPLYAVETVRKLLLDGRLEQVEGGRYRPVDDLARLDAPDTLQALIAARLDALEPAERGLLQDASILGHSFTATSLGAVNGGDAEGLEPRLRELVRRDFLVQNRDPRSPERGQFAFVQALIREVAYSRISRRDKRARHLAAARYFEALGEDELAGVLASHYLDAYRASDPGPETDSLGAQARIALRAAAERAARLHSHDQALEFLEQALLVTPEPADRAAILEESGAAAQALNRFDATENHLRAAIELYRQVGDRSGAARVTASLGLALVFTGRIEEAIGVLEAALEEFGHLDPDRNVVLLRATLARALVFHEENDRAIDYADRALVTAERLDEPQIIADAVMTKGIALAYAGRRREAIILMTGVLDLADEQGLIIEALRARLNISQFQLANDPRQSFETAKSGLERALRYGFRDWADLLFGNAAVAAVPMGEWDWVEATGRTVLGDWVGRAGQGQIAQNTEEAITQLDIVRAYRGQRSEGPELVEIERRAQASSDPQAGAQTAAWRAAIALIAGDLDAAVRGVEIHRGEPYYATAGLITAGHAAAWRRDAAMLARVLEEMEAIGLRGRYVDASRRTFTAARAALEGRAEQAGQQFLSAAAEWRDLGLPLGLVFNQLSFAALVPADPRAAEAAIEAREISQRLGAVALTARIEEVLRDARPRVGLAAPAS